MTRLLKSSRELHLTPSCVCGRLADTDAFYHAYAFNKFNHTYVKSVNVVSAKHLMNKCQQNKKDFLEDFIENYVNTVSASVTLSNALKNWNRVQKTK